MLSYPQPDLSDGTVVLRPWSQRDGATVIAAAQDRTVPASTSLPTIVDVAAAAEWIDRQDRRRRDGTGLSVAITRADRDRAVGMAAVTGIDHHHATGHLGYWVIPEPRGHGLGRRAVALLADWALATLRLTRLEARVAVDNVASVKALRAAEFSHEGTCQAAFRVGEGWTDMDVAARSKNVNRLLDPRWGNVDGELRLWDREGRLWTLARNDLDHETAARLYRGPNVPVAVAEGAGGLDWVDPAQRRRRWAEELEPRTFDAAWVPPRDAPGSLPFQALEFRSGDDRLLLFFDYD